jgi:hypothetical protein
MVLAWAALESSAPATYLATGVLFILLSVLVRRLIRHSEARRETGRRRERIEGANVVCIDRAGRARQSVTVSRCSHVVLSAAGTISGASPARSMRVLP